MIDIVINMCHSHNISVHSHFFYVPNDKQKWQVHLFCGIFINDAGKVTPIL